MRHGWDGVLTLPRVLSLDDNNDLIIEPVEELQSLRSDHVIHQELSVHDSEIEIDDVKGDALELYVSINNISAKEFGLRVLRSPDGKEATSIVYDVEENVLRVDLSKTSLDSTLMRDHWHPLIQEASLEISEDEALNLHVFVDKSVLEIFVNKKLCLTQRVFPSLKESQGITIFSVGGKIEVPEFNAWKMHPSNPW
jgi:beta-fructofuranosidase